MKLFDLKSVHRAEGPSALKGAVLVSVGIVVILLLPGGPFGNPWAPSVGSSAGNTPTIASDVVVVPAASANSPTLPGTGGPAPPSTSEDATITVSNLSHLRTIPYQLWGINVMATHQFGSADAATIADTPVTFLRFPGGVLGDQFNYTSGVIRNDDGSTTQATTSVKTFIQGCHDLGCSAILQLPAEINDPKTAAYYAQYVVKTLGFQPDYWEIGNSPPNWPHYNVPWSQWATKQGSTLTSLEFAQLVQKYITAVKAVDPKARFTALALGAGNYDKPWVTELEQVDGPNLSGISIHSYTMGSTPPKLTWAGLLSNLNGEYSLTTQVNLTRGYISAACPTCTTRVFVTESNAAEDAYSTFNEQFGGTLYVAAATVQALHVRLTNLDWFCYEGGSDYAWKTDSGQMQDQYVLYSQMMTHLGPDTLHTIVDGPSSFYAQATYGASSGMALLLVNVNMTRSVSVNLSHSGIIAGKTVSQEQWVNGTKGPTNSTFTLGNSVKIPPLSITILAVGPSGVVGGSPHPPSLHGSNARVGTGGHTTSSKTGSNAAPPWATPTRALPHLLTKVAAGPNPAHVLAPSSSSRLVRTDA